MSRNAACTVIVATNGVRGGMLVRCLQSIANQETPPAEVLCVSSSPDLPSSVASLARIIADEGRGASAAKNQALGLVKTELVAFTDDDCVADRRWLSALVRRFDQRGDGLAGVTGRVLPIRPGLYLVRSEVYPEARSFTEISTSLPPWKVGGGLNMAFRKEPLLRIGAFDVEFGPGARFPSAEELDLFYRLLAGGQEIDYDPDAIVYHEPLDTVSQVVRTRYAYRAGLSAFFVKSRADPTLRAISRDFLRAEVHDLRTSVLRGGPGSAVVALFGSLGFASGTIRARIRPPKSWRAQSRPLPRRNG